MPPPQLQQGGRQPPRAFYRHALEELRASGIPFLVGGALALEAYTGVKRYTKDLDLHVLPQDFRRVLNVLEHAGYRTEIAFSHWLGKAYCGDEFIDLIFNSGNGLCPVDAEWIEHAPRAEIFGLPLDIAPAEEMIWQKGFVLSRERYDGADVAHLIRARGKLLDWRRLLRRFDSHWQLLLSHLILFDFIYPAERESRPDWVLDELLARYAGARTQPVDNMKVCLGTLLAVKDFAIDLDDWGDADARAEPRGQMTCAEVEHWTAAFPKL